MFSGRDASRALATFSVDESLFKDTYDDLSDLKPSQLGSVKEWEMQFLGTFFCFIKKLKLLKLHKLISLEKYPVVGKLLKPDEEATDYTEKETDSND